MGCLLCDDSCKNQNVRPFPNFYNLSQVSSSSFRAIPSSSIDLYSQNTFLIESQYIFDLHLGEGAFGSVVKLIDKNTGQNYALKVLPKELLINLDLNVELPKTQMFLSEKLGNLNHVNINPIKVIYENEDNFFIVKDLSPISLQHKINIHHNFTHNEIKNIIYQILCGLDYLHENGIIHGNIRPENVMFCTNEHIKIDDYGLYEKFLRKSSKNVYLYVSPELIENSKIEKNDEWGVGVIMYLLYCNKYPFEESTFDELCRQITNGAFDQTCEEFLNIPEKGKNLLKKLLTFNSKYRISVHDALKHSFFEKNEDEINDTMNMYVDTEDNIISTTQSFDMDNNVNVHITNYSKQNFLGLTSSSLFDIENNLNMSTSNSQCITSYDLKILIRNYFVFIIVFYNEIETPDNIFKHYMQNNQTLQDKYSKVLNLFMLNNVICYDSNNDKNIIDYLSNNKIFLFGSNVEILFDYLKEKEINLELPKVCFGNIFQRIVTILNKEMEEKMILTSLDNSTTLSEDEINKKMSLKEFRTVLSNSTVF